MLLHRMRWGKSSGHRSRGPELAPNFSDLSKSRAPVALGIPHRLDRESRIAAKYGNLALISYERGDMKGAFRFHRLALTIHNAAGDPLRAAANYANLGGLYFERGHLLRARRQYRKAERLLSATNEAELAEVLDRLAEIELRRADRMAASIHYERALAVRRESSAANVSEDPRVSKELRRAVGNNMVALAKIAHAEGELDDADKQLHAALEHYDAIGDRMGRAKALALLGTIAHSRGTKTALNEAENHYREALALDESLGQMAAMAIQYANLGHVFETRDEPDEAESLFRKALAINERLGDDERSAMNYANLGVIAQARGDLDEAEAMYQRSLALHGVSERSVMGDRTPRGATWRVVSVLGGVVLILAVVVGNS